MKHASMPEPGTPHHGIRVVCRAVVALLVSLMTLLSVSAAPPPTPTITIDDSAGPLAVQPSTDLHVLRGSGFTPSSSAFLNLYAMAGCTGMAANLAELPVGSNSGFGFSGSFPTEPGAYSYQVVDANGGPSNCVDVIVGTPPFQDVAITITGDPRFPVNGSAVIDGTGDLTYVLGNAPTSGSVTVASDGSFTYIAGTTLVQNDAFTVLATDDSGTTTRITVTVILEIDPSVPTFGTVTSGGSSGGGGNASDARTGTSDPANSVPTSTPLDRDGRVQQP